MSGTIVLGIGNPMGGDDAAGTYLVNIINQRQRRASILPSPGIMAVDASTSPESYTSVIRQHHPDLLILVDAADMGLPAGALRAIPPEKISALSLSTHYIPLSMLVSYVKEFCGEVVLVGVQPERIGTGGGISKAVRQSVRKLAEIILEGRIAEIRQLE
jgi:hydrogenase 3 maturation protease